jgi:CBS domain containing-hemolysin-like protein
MSETLLWIIVACVGLALSAVFSGVETGVYSVNRLRLAVRAGALPPDRPAMRLQRELGEPERLIATLLIGNNMANYAGSLGLTALLVLAGFREWAVIVVNAVALTPVLFVLGETIPKDLFREEADRLTPRFALPLGVFRLLLTVTLLLPFVTIAAGAMQRLIGGQRTDTLEQRQRIGELLKEGASGGVLSAEQTSLIDRAMIVGELPISEAMRPWSRVVRIGSDWTGQRVIDAAIKAARLGQTRIPVVDRRGGVLGLARTVDAAVDGGEGLGASLAKIAPTIEASDSVRHALRLLTVRDASCAVVIADGEPVGIATYDDLMEPLLGVVDRD